MDKKSLGSSTAAVTDDPATQSLSPKGRRTRAQLLTAAEAVFSDVGFHTARIQDIAKAAGVSHGTFYTYFESKEVIFRTLVESLAAEMVNTRSLVRGDPIAAVLDGVRLYVDSYSRSRAMMIQFEHTAMIDNEVHELLRTQRDIAIARAERSLSRLQEAGHASEALDIFYTARALVAMTGRLCFEWFAFGEDLDQDAVVRVLTETWLRAAGMSPDAVTTETDRLFAQA